MPFKTVIRRDSGWTKRTGMYSQRVLNGIPDPEGRVLNLDLLWHERYSVYMNRLNYRQWWWLDILRWMPA